ncbi:MAG: hypothetical protein KDB80_11905 [Planctomycetes bacterium]|nr:hypothetical protein [Planctomycetota bacterium]
MRPIQSLLMLTALAAPAIAQDQSKKLLDLTFPGGNLAEFVAAVKTASGDGNVVASPLAVEVDVPPLTLKQATLLTSLKAVARIVAAPYHAQIEMDASSFGNEVYSVAVIKTEPAGPRAAGYSDRERVAVFSLAKLTSPLPTDPKGYEITLSARTVLSAIEAGLSVSRTKSQPSIKYHEDSRLLFVSGAGDQLSLVVQTLENLTTDLEERRNSAMRAAMEAERREQMKDRPRNVSTPEGQKN